MYNNIKEILSSDPFELLEWLRDNWTFELPTKIESERETRLAGNLMGELMNGYSFLCSLEGEVAMHLKFMKFKEAEKEEVKMMELRKTAVHTFVDILLHQYNAVSRMITTKVEADKELHMSDGYMERR